MTQPLTQLTANTVATIATAIDSMLQQRVAAFQITYKEKKRIADPATLVTELLHGTSDPHFHAVAHYQIRTEMYATKTVLTIEIAYLEDAEQLEYVRQHARHIVAQICAPTLHLHQKIMAIHDWVTHHVHYDHTLQRRTAYDALCHRSTVCSGYASLFWHLCDAAAIPCRIVTGVGKFEAHAWNMVQLDRQWYHVDSTWSTVPDEHTPFQVYRFYLLTDKEIQRTHTVTLLPGQKAFPPALMQYRTHLQQIAKTTPRARTLIRHIQEKTGLAYLEPEYTVFGKAHLRKRLLHAITKQQTRVLFGYRDATHSAQQDVRDVLDDFRNTPLPQQTSIKVMLYPMPHGFSDDGILLDVHLEFY